MGALAVIVDNLFNARQAPKKLWESFGIAIKAAIKDKRDTGVVKLQIGQQLMLPPPTPKK